MESEKTKIILPVYAKAAFILVALYLAIYVLILAKSLFVPIVFAALFSMLLLPVASFLEKPRFINRMVSTTLTVLFAVTVLAILIFFLYKQILLFLNDLPVVTTKLQELLYEIQVFINKNTPFEAKFDVETIRDTAVEFVQNNVQPLTQLLFSIVGGLTVFVLIPVYIFLFLYYRDFLQDFIMKLYRNNSTEYIESMIGKIQQVTKNYVGGMFLVSLILSVLNTIALMIIGVPHAIFFGFFAGFLNIIPYVGPIVGSLLPILFALLVKDSIWYAVAVFLYFYIVQQIESYTIVPAIVGKQVDMNPLVVILALFIGYYIWGIVGMILIIPVIAVLKRVFDEIESLKPFGFLLGGVPDKNDKEAFFKKLKGKIGRNKEDNS